MQKCRYRVEGVEEKVGLQLHLQGLQLRLGQLRLQTRSPQFASLVAMIIIGCIVDQQNHAINQQAIIEDGIGALEQADEGEFLARRGKQKEVGRIVQGAGGK